MCTDNACYNVATFKYKWTDHNERYTCGPCFIRLMATATKLQIELKGEIVKHKENEPLIKCQQTAGYINYLKTKGNKKQ